MTDQKPISYPVVAFMFFLSALLCATTVVLSVAPLKVLRDQLNTKSWWTGTGIILGVSIGMQFWVFALSFFAVVAMVSAFHWGQERGWSRFKSGLVAIAVAAVDTFFILLVAAKGSFAQLVAYVSTPVQEFVLRLKEVNPKAELETDFLLAQLPSGILVTLIFSLVLGLLLEGPLRRRLGWVQRGWKAESERYVDFRLPDVLIWFAIVALLGSFQKWDAYYSREIATNFFNVLLALYFLQGMAVIQALLVNYKMTGIWRGFMTVFLTLQLFLFVSFVGFLDYWFDFRSKIIKNGNGKKAEDIDEHLEQIKDER